MHINPTLLPYPRHLKLTNGYLKLSEKRLILLNSSQPSRILKSANRIQAAISEHCGIKFEITASTAVPTPSIGIVLRITPQPKLPLQGYHLQITPYNIEIEAAGEQGIFYGSGTAIQLFQHYLSNPVDGNPSHDQSLPCLEITDWPDFPNRGVMLDISRNKVPTMETMYALIDLLSSWKINQLQLYTEHSFAYQQHPEVWVDASPFTGEEILLLDEYCQQRYIELVPNQNSFGHLEHWLKLPRYQSLAEAPDGFDLPWAHHHGPFSLCPLDPASIELVSSLYDELLPHFSSRQVNVGCDETFDLGQGRSKETCAKLGTGRVYHDFLLKIYHEVTRRHHLMQFWGDIIIAHQELISELPKDAIALVWGYEADHPFNEQAGKLADSGLPFYVCPGTSSWNSIAGRTDNCVENITNAVINGLKFGASGCLICDWGDNGHWQVLPVSYLGFALGAALSWAYEANTNLDIIDGLNKYAFHDTTKIFGELAYKLGNLYQKIGIFTGNSSVLFDILQQPITAWQNRFSTSAIIDGLQLALQEISESTCRISTATSTCKDKESLRQEFILTTDLLRHACLRGLYASGASKISHKDLLMDLHRIKTDFESVWLLRNRPGGLRDSLSYFDTPMVDYEG